MRKAFSVDVAEAPLRRSDLPWLTAAIVSGGIVGPLLLMFGLKATSAASGALLLNIEGLATMAIAWVVFHENVDRRLLMGAVAILAGAVLLTWQGGGVGFDVGSALIASACVAWGIDNNLTRKLSASDPLVIAMVKCLVAGAVNTAIGASLGAGRLDFSHVVAAGIVGFFGIGVSLTLFVTALRHLGTARTGAYFSLAPFIGALIAVVMLHEPLTTKLLIAGALMGFGLWMHLTENHAHEHEPLEHEHAHVHDEHHQHQHDGQVTEPHSHRHRHERLVHSHRHFPDLHHRHSHGDL